jgi:hypothetical protein
MRVADRWALAVLNVQDRFSNQSTIERFSP